MVLAQDIVDSFAKIMSIKNEAKSKDIKTLYGTVRLTNEDGLSVLIDGSSTPIPVTKTVDVKDNDRVIVEIKNHSATIIGNVTDPASTTSTTDRIITELNVEKLKINSLEAEKLDVGELNSAVAEIESLISDKASIHDLEVTNEKVDNLEADKLDATFANFDAVSANKAKLQEFISKSGLVENFTANEQQVTGTLAAVQINADNITAGTLSAKRIALIGDDGVIYMLNTENLTDDDLVALTPEQQAELSNKIHGKSIVAESITADKIAVSDLSAFKASIGGFVIEPDSLHSFLKDNVNSQSPGMYLNNDGQFNMGGSNNFVKLYKELDDSGNYVFKLQLKTKEMNICSSKHNTGFSFRNMSDGSMLLTKV